MRIFEPLSGGDGNQRDRKRILTIHSPLITKEEAEKRRTSSDQERFFARSRAGGGPNRPRKKSRRPRIAAPANGRIPRWCGRSCQLTTERTMLTMARAIVEREAPRQLK